MRNTFVKLACLFVMLSLVLTGCNLIRVDPVMQADEDMEALKKDLATAMVKYDGGEITKGDMMSDINTQYSYLSYMYSMYGYTLDQSQLQGLVESTAQSHMNTRAVLAHAEELGVELTEEEIAECESAAKTTYDEQLALVTENVEADTEELRAKRIDYEMTAGGITYEQLLEMQKNTKIVEKVEAAVKSEIAELTDEELAAKLADQSAADGLTYASDRRSFETDMSDETKCVTWMPDGYRTVKHILVKPADDILSAVTDARSALTTAESALNALKKELSDLETAAEDAEVRTAEEINADIASQEAEVEAKKADVEKAEADCLASVQDKLDTIYAALEKGDAFDAVMAQYGEDPGMQAEPAMTTGYYVCAESEAWDTNFRNGAMALAKVGDYSETPVISTSGVHIIYYQSDVKGGAVALEDIRDKFYPIALENAQTTHMEETLESWVEALHPVYSTDSFFAAE